MNSHTEINNYMDPSNAHFSQFRMWGLFYNGVDDHYKSFDLTRKKLNLTPNDVWLDNKDIHLDIDFVLKYINLDLDNQINCITEFNDRFRRMLLSSYPFWNIISSEKLQEMITISCKVENAIEVAKDDAMVDDVPDLVDINGNIVVDDDVIYIIDIDGNIVVYDDVPDIVDDDVIDIIDINGNIDVDDDVPDIVDDDVIDIIDIFPLIMITLLILAKLLLLINI